MFNTPSFFEYRRCFTAPKSSPTLLPFNHADEDGSFSGVVNSQTGEITNLSKTGTQEQGEIERVAQDRINAIRPLANNISNTQEEKFRNQQEQIQILTSEIVSLKSEHRILKKRLSKKSKSDPKGIKKITDQIEKEDPEKKGVIESLFSGIGGVVESIAGGVVGVGTSIVKGTIGVGKSIGQALKSASGKDEWERIPENKQKQIIQKVLDDAKTKHNTRLEYNQHTNSFEPFSRDLGDAEENERRAAEATRRFKTLINQYTGKNQQETQTNKAHKNKPKTIVSETKPNAMSPLLHDKPKSSATIRQSTPKEATTQINIPVVDAQIATPKKIVSQWKMLENPDFSKLQDFQYSKELYGEPDATNIIKTNQANTFVMQSAPTKLKLSDIISTQTTAFKEAFSSGTVERETLNNAKNSTIGYVLKGEKDGIQHFQVIIKEGGILSIKTFSGNDSAQAQLFLSQSIPQKNTNSTKTKTTETKNPGNFFDQAGTNLEEQFKDYGYTPSIIPTPKDPTFYSNVGIQSENISHLKKDKTHLVVQTGESSSSFSSIKSQQLAMLKAKYNGSGYTFSQYTKNDQTSEWGIKIEGNGKVMYQTIKQHNNQFQMQTFQTAANSTTEIQQFFASSQIDSSTQFTKIKT